MNPSSTIFLFTNLFSFFGFFILLFPLFILVASAFWIWMIVDVAERHIPDKTPWLLVVILGHFIGAGIYYFVVRKKQLMLQPVVQPMTIPVPPLSTGGSNGIPQPQNIPQPPIPVVSPSQLLPYSGAAITSLVFGIISIFCFVPGFNLISPILAIIFGIVAHKKIKRGMARGGGIAITGIALGVTFLLISLAVTAFVVLVVHNLYAAPSTTSGNIIYNKY
jgi:hypothetical protein